MPFLPLYDLNPTTRKPLITVTIIVINVISMLAIDSLSDYDQRLTRVRFGFVPARLKQLEVAKPIRIGLYGKHDLRAGNFPPRGMPAFVDLPPAHVAIPLTAITSLFIHGSWMHLLGNMWFFWIFGNNIEDRLGHVLFFAFYLIGGAAASLAYSLMTVPNGQFIPIIGASGAVAVTLGAYAVTYPFARVQTFIFLIIFFTVVELPALAVLGFWFLMQMISAAHLANRNFGGGVAWWAHISGFVAGAAVMPLLSAMIPLPPTPRASTATATKDAEDYRLPPEDFV